MECFRAGQFSAPEGTASYVEQFAVPALSVGTYSIPAGADDPQSPHTEDEVYVVTQGRGSFTSGGVTVEVEPGSALYVPKHEAHRFHDVAEDLVVLVFFAPAYGTGAP